MSVNLIIALLLMGLTGYLDAHAFGRAPHIWNLQGSDRLIEILKTLSLFIAGILTYIFSTYFLHQQGVENSLIVTLVWFSVTIVGVALVTGAFMELSVLDRIIAIAAIILVGLLYFRGVGE